MMDKILSLTDVNFVKADILDGVRSLQNISIEKNIECFAVLENEKLVGVITRRELAIAHPNRIAIDAMNKKYICVDSNTYTWRVLEIFNANKDIDRVFIQDSNKIIGFVTKDNLNINIGRHIDLLTGLYKSDYIVYNAYRLIERGEKTSFIFIDLNKFGSINKKYGHIYGDLVIKNIADILLENMNPDTYLCRYAGDEFAVVTTYNRERCEIFAESLINAIRSHKFPYEVPVSASIGISGCKLENKKNHYNIINLINKLINTASLASTKAKESNGRSVIIGNMDVNIIA